MRCESERVVMCESERVVERERVCVRFGEGERESVCCACESIGERGERIAFNCVILIIHRRRNYVFTAFLERRKPSETHLKKLEKKKNSAITLTLTLTEIII